MKYESSIIVRYRVYILLILFIKAILVYADTNVDTSLKSLVLRINKINQNINGKQQRLSEAIDYSNEALDQSGLLLMQLKQNRELKLKQLDEINQLLPTVAAELKVVESNVQGASSKIYQQIRMLENQENNSLLNSDNALQVERKKRYLINLLQEQYNKYKILQTNLKQLNKLSFKIGNELNRLDDRLAHVH